MSNIKDYSGLISLLRTEDGGGVIDYDSVMEQAADAIEDLSEQVKPRKLGDTDYEVRQSLWVGDCEIIMAERPKYGEGDKFLCGLYETNGAMERYKDCMASDDFGEIVDLYVQRIQEQMQKVRDTISLPEGIDNSPIMQSDSRVKTDSHSEVIRNKVVVINPSALSPEYLAATSQLWLCTGGFGFSANPRGRTCFCINLHDPGRRENFYRNDVIGTIDPADLPEWAKNGLEKALQANREGERRSLSSQIQTAEEKKQSASAQETGREKTDERSM